MLPLVLTMPLMSETGNRACAIRLRANRSEGTMSGPKTSDLSVEERTKERIQRARNRVTDAETNALVKVEVLEAELRAYAKTHEGLENVSAQLEHIVSEAVQSIHAAAVFDMEGSPDAAERHAQQIEATLGAIVTQAHHRMAPAIEHIKRAQTSAAESESVSSFAHAMKQSETPDEIAAALDALTAAAARNVSAGDSTAARPSESHSSIAPGAASPVSSTAPASPDEVANLMGILDEARAIIMRAETLESDRTALSSIAREASKAAESAAASGTPLTSAEVAGLTAQAQIIQSRMASQEEPLARALARIRVLEAQLGSSAGARPPAFKDADSVFARLDSLEAAMRERDEQRYIRACIDEVMREHGYDVVRSVDFSGTARGEHLMFTNSSAQRDASATGIHAFFTEAGDMMLEVVGVRGESGAIDHDRMDAAATAPEKQDLLAAQTQFCAVYAEIADDLAKRGVVNKVIHKAAPDMRHCKTITFASGKKRGAAPGVKRTDRTSKTKAPASAHGSGKAKRPAKKRSTGVGYVTVPTQPSGNRRRPAQKLHTREMR